MKVLFIAPLPPPVTGHSLVSKVLCDELVKDYEVEIINLSKDSFEEGVSSFKRLHEVLTILLKVFRQKKNADIIYLTISESFAGNLKDIFMYLICFSRLSQLYIHLHGGSIKRLLWDSNRFLHFVNKIFIKRMAGVIVSGQSHLEIFDGMIESIKIHIVPNFAQDYLFRSEEEICAKFSMLQPLRILYISNFIPKKGFNEIVDAYFALSDDMKKMVKIDFAGTFESDADKKAFLDKIAMVDKICYHGFVDDVHKKELFAQAHIFCLPTSYFEGQPISILEAYASGCVVLTTGQSGIRDIFTHGQNGYEVLVRSAKSIKGVLINILHKPEDLLKIAMTNRSMAGERYRVKTYTDSLKKVLDNSGR